MGLHTNDIARQMETVAESRLRQAQEQFARQVENIADSRQRLAQEQTADVKILQKVNSAHREAFAEKYPGQVEHCLSITMERLQAGLEKRGDVDIGNPDTWRMTPAEIEQLARTAQLLNDIRRGF